MLQTLIGRKGRTLQIALDNIPHRISLNLIVIWDVVTARTYVTPQNRSSLICLESPPNHFVVREAVFLLKAVLQGGDPSLLTDSNLTNTITF